jgi:hypothetical protein
MAHRGKHGRFVKGGSTSIVRYRAPSHAKPIVVRVGGGTTKKKHHGGRRKVGGSVKNRMMGAAIGGFAVGQIEKMFPNLPTLPVVGKKGAIALGVMFMSKSTTGIIADIGFAAAVMAGYEFATTGKVSGFAGPV